MKDRKDQQSIKYTQDMDENGSGLIVTLSLLLMDYYYLISVPGGSDGKESACNAGDPAFIP